MNSWVKINNFIVSNDVIYDELGIEIFGRRGGMKKRNGHTTL